VKSLLKVAVANRRGYPPGDIETAHSVPARCRPM